MTITEQLKAIRNALSEWAVSEGGRAFVAYDHFHMWHVSANNTKSPLITICCTGEDVRGDYTTAAVTGRVDRHFEAMITKGKGYTAERGDDLVEEIGNSRAFYDLVEEARDTIRKLLLDPTTTERPIDYKGITAVYNNDFPVGAYIIHFDIGTQLGIIQTLPDDLGGSPPEHTVDPSPNGFSWKQSPKWDSDEEFWDNSGNWRS